LELKKRLAALHNQRHVGTDVPPDPVSQRLQRLSGRPGAAPPRQGDEQIAQLLGGVQLAEGLVVVDHQVPLSHRHGRQGFAALISQSYTTLPLDPRRVGERLVFLDTETTGLAGGTGTLVFLLGLGRVVGHTLQLRQLFLTGFRGEVALLEAARAWVGAAEYLVTFNGKSFDAPLLAARYRLSGRLDPFTGMQHLDLLHPTRRAFASRWADCRLQTAERHLLGFHRHDDLPAYLVPEVWFAFVRQGITDRLAAILAHNRWDLMSLVGLLPILDAAFATPAVYGADVVAVARYWLQQGDEQAALRHLQSHQEQLSTAGLLELARLYRRRQAWEAAVTIWRRLAHQDCPEALERLAKYYEHVSRDLRTALHCTRRLRALEGSNRQHAQREQRLMHKLTSVSSTSSVAHRNRR
jgi:uncharacterized protein YprB with RNaseH-like and TPR domain